MCRDKLLETWREDSTALVRARVDLAKVVSRLNPTYGMLVDELSLVDVASLSFFPKGDFLWHPKQVAYPNQRQAAVGLQLLPGRTGFRSGRFLIFLLVSSASVFSLRSLISLISTSHLFRPLYADRDRVFAWTPPD